MTLNEAFEKRQSLSLCTKLDNTLDSCLITIILNEKIEYKKWDLFNYKNKNWYIFNIDYKETSSGIENSVYLIEPTKKLENFIIKGCAFTNYNNAYDQVVACLYKFNVSFSIDENLKNYKGIDLKYSGEITLREVLDDIFSVFDSRVYFDNEKITYQNPNKKGNSIIINNFTEKNENINSEYEVDAVMSSAENVFMDNFIEEYVVERGELGLYNNSTDAAYYLGYGISEIISIKLKYSYSVKANILLSSGQTASKTYEGIVFLDFTPFIKSLDEWQVLPEGQDQIGYQNLTFWYEFKGNKIGGLMELKKPNGGLFSKTVQENIIYYITYNSEYYRENYLKLPIMNAIIADNPSDTLVSLTSIPNVSYLNKAFVKYYPIDNITIIDNKNQNTQTKIIQNYNYEQTNETSFVKNISGLKNRIGNREITFNVATNDIEYNLGDYLENSNYILDSISYNEQPSGFYVTYHFTENYNNINENIRLNREKRIFNIPDNNIERILELNLNIYISTELPENYSYNFYYNFYNSLIYYFRNSQKHVYDPKVYYLYVTRKKYNEGSFIPVNSYSTDNAVYIKASCYDNYAINYRLESNKVVGLKYTDDTGETNDLDISIQGNLSKTGYTYDSLWPDGYGTLVYYGGFDLINLYKDTYEKLTFLIKHRLIAENNDIIIGSGYYSNHFLIKNNNYNYNTIFKINYTDFFSNSLERTTLKENDVDYSMNYNSPKNSITFDFSSNVNNKPVFEIITSDNKLLMRGYTKNTTYYFYEKE